MQTLKFLLPTVVLLLVVSLSNAQTMDDYHRRMAEHHEAIRMKSEELMNGRAVNRNAYPDEMQRNIEAARRQHMDMQRGFTPAQRTIAQPYNDAIGNYHNNMLASNNSLRTELAKPQPNEALVKQYSGEINKSAVGALEQHKQMKNKGVK